MNGKALAHWLSGLLLVGFVSLRLLTWEGYGLSWDEPFRWDDGRQELKYFQELLAGERALGEGVRANDVYPPLFDLAVAATDAWTELNPMQAGHMWSNVLALSAVVAVWLTGWRMAGPWAGLAAAVCLVLMPRFYGHMGFNPKDIPFAAGYAWVLFWLVEVGLRLPRPPWWSIIGLGVGIGLNTALRTPGLAGISYAALLLGGPWLWKLGRSKTWPDRDRWLELLRRLAQWGVIVVCAYGTVLLVWPAMHDDPWHLFGAASGASSYPWNAPVLYMGQVVPAGELPWHYLPVWLLITLPEPVLILLFVGLLLSIVAVVRSGASGGRAERLDVLERAALRSLLAFSVCLPIGYALLGNAVMYDGLRQMLFVHVPLALLAGLSWDSLRQRLQAQARHLRAVVITGALLLGAAGVGWRMARLYPYEYTFFNTTVGGLAGARGRFETEYWATSYREAVERLEASLDREEGDHPPYRIDAFKAFASARPFVRPPNIFDAGSVGRGGADFYIMTTRTNLHLQTGIPASAIREDLRVERDGAPFCVVYDLRTR